MHKQIITAAVALDEPKSLFRVIPLDCSGGHCASSLNLFGAARRSKTFRLVPVMLKVRM
jgi:hypothetical protein